MRSSARGPVCEPVRCRRANGSQRGGHRAADPRRRPGLAEPAASRAALAVARGQRRVTRPGGRANRADRRAGHEARRRPIDGPAIAAHPGATAAGDHGARTVGRFLRCALARCPTAGRRAVPAGTRAARCGDECVARGSRAGTGSARRPRGDPTAPDDRARDGVPGARGRDRDGQRHALARHLGPSARRRPPARAARSSTERCSARPTW